MSLATITSLRRGLSEWTLRDGNRRVLGEDQVAQLHAALDDPNGLPRAHTAAWMLGTWQLGNGFLQVLDGDAEGFDEARTGQALRRCALLLRASRQMPRGLDRAAPPLRRLPFSALHGAWTVLLALALDDPNAEDLHERVRELPDAALGPDDRLLSFARELLRLRHGQRVALNTQLGPYQHVLLHWHSEPRVFAQRLAELLDLHLEQAHGIGADFGDPPCRLYPVEVLAIRNVRTWLELPTPKVDHPLMFTNLATMTPRTAWPQDELVRRLERSLRR